MGSRLVAQCQPSPLAKQLFKKAGETFLLDSSVFYVTEALKLSERSGNLLDKTYALYLLGKTYNEKSDYKQAEKYLEIGLVLSKKIKDKNLEGLLLIEKGRCHQFKKEHALALGFFLEAYKIFEQLNEMENIFSVNVYLAEYYRNLGKFNDALNNIRAALKISKNCTIDKQLQILLYNRAAAIKSETSQSDSSLYYSNIALKISEETGNLNQQAVSLNEIAFIFESKGKILEAIDGFKKAEDIWLKAGYKRYWITALENSARCYGKIGQYKKSNERLLQLVDVAKKNEWTANLTSAYYILNINYAAMGDFQNSDKYKALSCEAGLDVYKKEYQKELEEIKTKYEIEKKDNLLREQQKEIDIANFKFNDQKKETLNLLYGIGTLTLLSGLIFFIAWQRTKLNKQLQLKNEQIEDVNLKLLAALNRSEVLMRELHHRVKNNLQIISSMFHLQSDATDNEGLKSLLMESDARIMLIAFLHEKLYSRGDVSNVSAKEYIEEIVNKIFLSFSSESSSIHFTSEIDNIQIQMDKAVVVGIIINELITNSIKHAFDAKAKNKEIKVHFFMQESKTILKVSDNGKGVPDNFSLEKSSSFGLNLVSIMAGQGNGNITINNKKGTEISIEL